MPSIAPKKSLTAKFKNGRDDLIYNVLHTLLDRRPLETILCSLSLAMVALISGNIYYTSEAAKDTEKSNNALVEAFNNNSKTFTDARGIEWRIFPERDKDGNDVVKGYEILSRDAERNVLSIARDPEFVFKVPSQKP